MAWRFLSGLLLALGLAAWSGTLHAQQGAGICYLPLDAPAGMSQAVVVDSAPLVYTRQLLPLDRNGKLVGEGSAQKQSAQVLANLQAALGAAGSDLGKVVRLNVCALSHEAADCVLAQLRTRLDASVRPAIATVLTPLPHRKALVAVDAVAVASARRSGRSAVTLLRYPNVAGVQGCADVAVMAPGGVAYVSGVPERGGLTESATTRSLATLLKILRQANLSPSQVVQVKVFLAPASAADEVLAEVKKAFPGQLAPPVVFVEWLASAPVEIELVASLPAAEKPGESPRYFTPPDARPSAGFSRIAMVQGGRQVFISGLSSRQPGDGEAQARDVFAQLKQILAEAGSDFTHLAKATYYVSDDDANKGFDTVRSEHFNSDRPPAASKVMVHGVSKPERTLTVDMIAVGK